MAVHQGEQDVEQQNCSPHDQEVKREEKEVSRAHDPPEDTFTMTKPSTWPCLPFEVFIVSQQCHPEGKPLTYRSLKDIPAPNYSTALNLQLLKWFSLSTIPSLNYSA